MAADAVQQQRQRQVAVFPSREAACGARDRIGAAGAGGALRGQTEHPGKREASALFPTLLRLSVCVSSVENIGGVIRILRRRTWTGEQSSS